MNVSGLTSSTDSSAAAPSRHRAISASAGAVSNASRSRPAIRSMTSNPTLCRVPRYFAPGLPRPATSFISSADLFFFLVLLVLAVFLVLGLLDLALLDDFRLGWSRRTRRHGRRIGHHRFRF